MSTQTMTGLGTTTAHKEHSYSFVEMHALRHAHPRKMFCDVVAMLWAFYFLYYQNWLGAVLSVAVIGGLGMASAWNIDADKMAHTTLGRLALLHLKPMNFALNLLGAIGLAYGVWTHSVETTLIGASVLLLGHIQGWSEMDSCFVIGK